MTDIMGRQGLNLHEKLLKIQGECQKIPKNGYNDYSNYYYRRAVDVVEAVAKHCEAERVFISVDVLECHVTQRGEKGSQAVVRIQYTLTNADNPSEKLVSTFWGLGHDSGDKSLYKAFTGAEKYFYLQTFKLGSEDDPEVPEKQEKKPTVTPKPVQKPTNLKKTFWFIPSPSERMTTWISDKVSEGRCKLIAENAEGIKVEYLGSNEKTIAFMKEYEVK